MTALHAHKLFSRLPESELRQLEQVTRQINYSAGQQVFKEGDPGDGVYIVKSGQVQISARVESGERHMFSKIGPGEMFGEMAVLDEKPRSASASADTSIELYFIPREYVMELLSRSPEFTRALVHEISDRLREFNRQYIRNVLQNERLSLVGRFASSIVHDLKNPLTIINMATDLACSDNATVAARKMAKQRIRKQVDRITYMVNDILEFTRGANTNPVLTPIDYAEFVQAIIDDLQEELQENKITLEIQAEAPKIKVGMNPKRLTRVFHNLIGNAIDEMPRGGAIKLRFAMEGNEIISEIEDTGRGIAPEILDRLFEAFATHGKSKGTGLGLSICQRIIEEHGGRISARNQAGGGAIFRFSLPVAHDQ